jgi:hypothetical protein
MNTIDTLIARVEEYRATNANPCKNYKTQAAAEKATASISKLAGAYFDIAGNEAEYIVVFNAAWGRWIGAVNLNELISRKTARGGYLGIVSNAGFFSY